MKKSDVAAIIAIFAIIAGSTFVLTANRPLACDSKIAGQKLERMSRGQILAADRTVLAEDEAIWDLHLDPCASGSRTNVWTNTRVATMIAERLHLPLSEIVGKFAVKNNRYIPIKTTRDTNEVAAVKDFGLALRLCVQEKVARRYPLGRMACHFTGFCQPSENVSELPIGGAGVESGDEDSLAKGFHTQTDIIPELQIGLYQLLSNAVAATECESANAIVLSQKLEHVLALVSYPDYDPCEYGRATQDQLLNRCIHSLEYPGAMLRPLLSSAITNDSNLIRQRLVHLGFGKVPDNYELPKAASGRILEDGLWTERYRENVLKGQGFVASTYQIAIAYVRSACEANPIPRAQSSAFYYDMQTESITNTVNILEVTNADKVMVITIKKPKSNIACRTYLSKLNVDTLIGK